jgi:hypothetical protein
MARNTNLTGVYAYRFEDGVLEPMLVAYERNAAGILTAHFSLISSERKSGATREGIMIDDIDVAARNLLTFAAVARAARKARTAVVLGRPVTVNAKSAFGAELARLERNTVKGIILAPWRVEQHDAKKATFTLKALYKAVVEFYNQ